MHPLRNCVVAACLLFASHAGLAAIIPNTYSQLVFFGDSLSDNGNVFTATGGLYPPGGRFSNGPVAAEYMAGALGLNLTDFAYGGAKTGTDGNGNDSFLAASLGLNGTGMQAQVGMYTSMVGAAGADPEALFGVWGGPNDYFEPGMVPPESVGNLMVILGDLYVLGARNFFVPNMPDLGLTAQFVGTSLQGDMTFLSGAFNALLDQALMSFQLALPDARVITFDTFNFLHDVVASPGAFGLQVVDAACTDSPACVLDPDLQSNYLFWDGVHPTTAAHAQLGLAFARSASNAMPEPSTALLALLAVIALVGIGRRAR